MNNNFIRKLFIFLKSMKCGIMLLLMVMTLSIAGSVIPQGFDEHFYSTKYHPMIVKVILALGLNDIFSSLLFGILFGALAMNLIMCSIARFDKILKKLRGGAGIESMRLLTTFPLDDSIKINSTLKETFRAHGFYSYRQSKTNADSYFSLKNNAGFFGSWLLHLGILLVIIFYGYGHVTFFSEAVYGVSGTVQTITGTPYKARIQDFDIEYRKDGSIQQYTSTVELLDEKENPLKSSTVSVNNPMRFMGYTFYQTSYGWASNCQVVKNGSKLAEDTLYEKTSLNVPGENVGIYFNKLYPDFAATSTGMTSLTDELKNPVVVYTLFYLKEIVKMDVVPIGETIKWNEYEFILETPQRYTYLNVNKMKGQFGAAVGALFIITGLLLAFYIKPARMAVKLEQGKLYIYGDRILESNILKITKGEE